MRKPHLALEEKVKKVLETDKLPPLKEKPRALPAILNLKYFQALLTCVLLIILFTTTFFLAYLTDKRKRLIPKNFEDCLKLKGSVIQKSYPPVCINKDGKRFIQNLPDQEKRLLEADFEKTKVKGVSFNPTSFSTSCIERGKELLEEVNRCQQVTEEECHKIKQEFDKCVLSCKKDLGENECFVICKPVCENQVTSDGISIDSSKME
ncbi:hypothetical protein A2686_03750 [Candidatus Woesebacteria bacterium RIFCSPHIGHO2_01_FULL_38_10]|uniref:Uncharacterized protein n=1 Tax=Candidatus Woesebacteria bacterium RIFCSPLOWO2_01_FULL_39_10b TaxID=1802517 RepID=A0A1F8B794_9BACT|nr:MAG: hypothetical protein A2686_03750 [Candidatus Woesebacteria bacterium RIFCSPHIGHO2_01_FULL_38_10]OGM59877.1 MAG: hypothetical protein A2892_02745 [Candidatus Woesebacteria bacterium RIFCSPLOWO2_01_FULL_39_10b]